MQNSKNKRHVELNVHSCGAYGETVLTPKEIVSFAVQNGSSAVAITDLNSVNSLFDFARAVDLSSSNIKPIYGVRLSCQKADGSEFLISLLAKTKLGLKNIFRIMSSGYNQELNKNKWPCVQWEYVLQNKEDVLIGRECLWDFVRDSQNDNATALSNKINALFDGVDYVELLPITYDTVSSGETDYEKTTPVYDSAYKIVDLLQKLGKNPVAVSNASCITEEDKLCWNILHQEDNKQKPAFMRLTEEMLVEFSFLQDLAEKVVIDNSNLIADMIDFFEPRPLGPSYVYFPDAEEEVRLRCEKTAEDKYGKQLPEVIRCRLDDELNKISYSDSWSRYLLAAKLSDKCKELGYLHTVRGTAGSSFVTYLLGISETNPLPPHYYCQNCKSAIFADESKWSTGFDLEKRICPTCGSEMKSDGHNIPCELFLGFIGDKLPDFDINIPDEIFDEMLGFLGEVFGKGKIYQARTLGRYFIGISSRMVKRYCKTTGETIDDIQKDRIIKRMSSVCKKAEKHPGRFIIVPQGKEIYDYSPIGYSNIFGLRLKEEQSTQIEHLDYYLEKIDILKFSLLSELKQMEEYTGVKPESICFKDIDYHCFFDSYIGLHGFSFNTKFMQKLFETVQPHSFSDLMKISGFAHGTGTWNGNAENLISDHPVEELIAFRDDVMIYLMRYGLSRKDAFRISECVRKGKAFSGFDEKTLALLRDNNVPEWLIESMQKIRYLFPKSHAVEYLIYQLRKVWYKIYHPLAFYASVLTNDVAPFFDYSILTEGKARVELEYQRFNNEWGKEHDFSERSDEGWAESEKRVLELALECYDNGIVFLPADINLSDDRRFTLESGNIRIPYNCANFLTPETVKSINAEREKKHFDSRTDFIERVSPDDYTLEELEKRRLFTQLDQHSKRKMVHIGELVNKVLAKEFFMEKKQSMSYVPDCESLFDTAKSGYNALEELSLEFSSGNFYLIGGRPGMGKTALMLDIALHAAENDSTPVFIFSLDKTAEQLTMRLISKYSNIPLDQCLCGDRDCIPTLELVRDKIAKLPIFICDEVVTVNEITEIIHSEKMRGLVFIDFLQLIDVGVEQYGNSNNAICSQPVFERQFEISNCLKSIAQDENTAIIALAQLARRLEERADKRPILGDIRYNRFIEQVADSIVYIYRYSYYYWGEDETEQSDSAELIVAKNRFGKTGNAIVKYDRDTTSFVE